MSTPKRPQRPVRPRRPEARAAVNVDESRKSGTTQADQPKRGERKKPQRVFGNRRNTKPLPPGGASPAKPQETETSPEPTKRAPDTKRTKQGKAAKPAKAPTKAKVARSRTSATSVATERTASPGKSPVVHAGKRFASRVRKKPWQKNRRLLPLILGSFVLLLSLAVLALAFLPQLKVSDVRVAGATYVDVSALEQVASAREGQPLAFTDLNALEEDLSAVQGVKAAKATRHWPNTVRVVITERTAIAQLESGGSTSLVDGSGAKLPANAANPASLPRLVVAPAAPNAEATESALLDITRVLPPNLRAALTKATANSPSSVTLEVATQAGPRTVVWGGPEDSELKARVLEALLNQPGAVIDVSSPEAPTIR
ncbi:FtsQ-type POTRA domain-containing protein [Dermabacter sp. Marseille-Q3180]|uniref:cell division protein FtsQ/DivIB n=1 Tax=Dermabacter sp. Marseille-Q3180 TaxID=2758090 RepID=UPI002024E3CA|nr:FtsQ-type POTRA domain-containing protein [Dermabacter sp. Marseille-Q3180]